MARSNASPRRSPAEWGVRLALAGLAAIGACLSLMFSLGQVQATANPVLAHRLSPYSGRITGRLAAALSGADATKADRQRADKLALLALQQDPATVAALAVLGTNAQLRGDTARARVMFNYSEKLSRRDAQTQLWLIEDAVGRSDISGALRHYDIALRTSPKLADLLFPVLTAASSENDIRAPLIHTLANKPAWSESFVNYAATTTSNPRATARLLTGLRHAGFVVPERAHAALIDTLFARGAFDEAWAYYTGIRPGADRRRSRDATFSAELKNPSVFDWVSQNDAGMDTSIQRGKTGGVFYFSAPASVGGTLIQQGQMLPAGTYRIAGNSVGIDQNDNARPFWTLRCQDGRELGRIDLPNSSQAQGSFEGKFAVPTGCPVQTLVLIARPSDAVGGLSGELTRVQVLPVR